MKRWVRLLGWIVVWATSLFFVKSGIQKLAGSEEMIVLFHEMGYPDWFRILVGVIEILGAIVLAFPRITLFGALGLGSLMIGAVISELASGRTFEALLAGQWLLILIIVVVLRIRIQSQTKSKGLST